MGKAIVVCCDGTWNKADQTDPTNVQKLFRAMPALDGRQVVRYVDGVGTGAGAFDKLVGGIFGFGLSARVLAAYRHVVENYEDGDRIFLIGFSRGAYTARSTAGMIRNVGVLKPGFRDDRHYRTAMSIYRNRTSDSSKPDGRKATVFREQHSFSPRIEFLGVWDTVGRLGIPLGGLRILHFISRRWLFHDTTLSSAVAAAYQALAIDERRRPFQPCLWTLSETAQRGDVDQIVEQVWFSGVHSNVGGGYRDTGLSDIALNWMASKAYDHGLRFTSSPPADADGRTGAIKEWVATRPDPDGILVDSRTRFYRLIPPYVRPMGAGRSSNQAVFYTAAARLESLSEYRTRASNLRAYLGGPSGRILPIEQVTDPADLAVRADLVGPTDPGPAVDSGAGERTAAA